MGVLNQALSGDVEWETQEWGAEYREVNEDGQRIVYQDWSPLTSKVVSGPYGESSRFRGKWFPTRDRARRYWQLRAGRIYEEFFVKGRWIFRVRKDA